MPFEDLVEGKPNAEAIYFLPSTFFPLCRAELLHEVEDRRAELLVIFVLRRMHIPLFLSSEFRLRPKGQKALKFESMLVS